MVTVSTTTRSAQELTAQARDVLGVSRLTNSALTSWLPGLPGVEVCRALRDDPAHDGIRIVMLTARTQHEDREAAHAMGADDYITKPFSPIELLEKVRDVLGPEALL